MSGETILMVEDNPDILRDNREVLELAGYRVLEAGTLAVAKAVADRERLDLILLDILLPDGNGLECCRELFGYDGPRILFLSALGDVEDVVAGLRKGDDYITKPYKISEMLARVSHLLEQRREPPPQVISRGPLTLDVVAARALLYGVDMLLSGKEFSLLLYLARHEGEALSKEAVYEAVWGQPLGDDSNALYIAVSRLKKKLEPARGEGILLSSRRGEGYRFSFRKQEK